MSLLLQVFLLIVIAYIVGCIVGCLLHQFFTEEAPVVVTDDDAALMSATEPQPTAASLLPQAPAPVLKPRPAKVEVPVSREASLPDLQLPRAPRLDDLKRIRGIGRENEIRLNAIGVTSYDQIANWSTARQAEIGARFSFPGRIEREDWVGQARVLAKGEQTDFSRRVDTGDAATSDGEVALAPVGKKPKTLKAPRRRKPDDLTRIEGVGKAVEDKLNAVGIFHINQIAGWSEDEAAWIGQEIGFPGRVEREDWVAQAAALQERDTAAKPAPKKRKPVAKKARKSRKTKSKDAQ